MTNGISLALGGQSATGIAAGVASPYINEQIKQATKDIPELNIPSHMLWGAVEAELQGGKAVSGAISAGVGEASAKYLSQALFNESNPEKLNEAQKKTLSTLSQVSAGVASGLSTAVEGGSTYRTAEAVSTGMGIAKNAVENNYLLPNQASAMHKALRDAFEKGESLEDIYAKYKEISKAQQEELQTDCLNSSLCTWTTQGLIDDSTKTASDATGFIGSFFSKLSPEEQAKYLEFVISENEQSAAMLEGSRSFAEKLITQMADDYIANVGNRVNKTISPKISNFAKKSKVIEKNRVIPNRPIKTDSEAYKVAKELGYTKTNYRTKSGAAVFKNGNSYITRDVDSHNGGAWKEASTPEKLNKKETRNGTFDINLNKIGD